MMLLLLARSSLYIIILGAPAPRIEPIFDRCCIHLINYEQATAKVKSSEGTQLRQTSRARVYDLAHVLVSCDFHLREYVRRI